MTTKAAASAISAIPLLQRPVVRRNAQLLVVYGMFIALFVFASLSSERFLTDRNLSNILRQAAFLGTVAVGETFVILMAGIDLSVGSLVKLGVLIAAIIISGDPNNVPLAVLAMLGLGTLVGSIHATIITRLNVAPFIVTLGSYSIMRGLALFISDQPIGRASPDLLLFYDSKLGPVSVLGILFLVLIVLSTLVLRKTPFGRYIYAIGGNEQVARLSGIPVNRVKYGAYILCSVLAALTSLLLLSRMGVGDPVIGDGLELQAITAVILGGTSLFGGRGGMIGTLGGVLLLGLTSNVLVVLNVNQWIQQLIEGLIVILAVALYKQKGRQ